MEMLPKIPACGQRREVSAFIEQSVTVSDMSSIFSIPRFRKTESQFKGVCEILNYTKPVISNQKS